MAVLEIQLMAELSREVGDVDSTNLYYTANEIFSALNDGLKDYNLKMPQQFAVVDSGDNAYYNPDPSSNQQRLIVLYSSRVLLKGELAKQARQAIIHTNPTGRTDLSLRPKWTLEALREKNKEIRELEILINSDAINADVHSGTGSMELRNEPSSTLVEGLPITVITTTV